MEPKIIGHFVGQRHSQLKGTLNLKLKGALELKGTLKLKGTLELKLKGTLQCEK